MQNGSGRVAGVHRRRTAFGILASAGHRTPLVLSMCLPVLKEHRRVALVGIPFAITLHEVGVAEGVAPAKRHGIEQLQMQKHRHHAHSLPELVDHLHRSRILLLLLDPLFVLVVVSGTHINAEVTASAGALLTVLRCIGR